MTARPPDVEALVAGPEEHGRVLHKALAKERRRIVHLERAIRWALGLSPSGFPDRQPGEGAYWWRSELWRRSGLPKPDARHIRREKARRKV